MGRLDHAYFFRSSDIFLFFFARPVIRFPTMKQTTLIDFDEILDARSLVDRAREIQTFFVEANSWAISFAITFGIAPLLFMQVNPQILVPLKTVKPRQERRSLFGQVQSWADLGRIFPPSCPWAAWGIISFDGAKRTDARQQPQSRGMAQAA